MITVGEALELAKYGELKTLVIKENDRAVMGYLRLGLVELYKRFPIKENEWIVTMVDGQYIYGADDPAHPGNKFPDDLMMITKVDDQKLLMDDSDTDVPINDREDILSVNHISWNRIQIMYPVDGLKMSIIYKASPEKLFFTPEGGSGDVADTSTKNQIIPMPDQCIDALL